MAARRQLRIASHPVTGLYPDYSTYDGEPFRGPYCGYDSRRFQYDAIRCPMNVGMDYYLFGADRELQSETMLRLLTFFRDEGFEHGQFDVLACIECALGWKCIYRDRLVVARIRHHIA